MLDQQRLGVSDAIAEQIGEYCEAAEEFNREATEQRGFVALAKCGDEKERINTRRMTNPYGILIPSSPRSAKMFWRLLQMVLEKRCWFGQEFMRTQGATDKDPNPRDVRECGEGEGI